MGESALTTLTGKTPQTSPRSSDLARSCATTAGATSAKRPRRGTYPSAPTRLGAEERRTQPRLLWRGLCKVLCGGFGYKCVCLCCLVIKIMWFRFLLWFVVCLFVLFALCFVLFGFLPCPALPCPALPCLALPCAGLLVGRLVSLVEWSVGRSVGRLLERFQRSVFMSSSTTTHFQQGSLKDTLCPFETCCFFNTNIKLETPI